MNINFPLYLVMALACVASITSAQTHDLLELDTRHYSNNRSSSSGNQEEEPQTVCVTLEEYGNMKCKGKPSGTNIFPVLTEPGSPCKHTPEMKHNSVRDQYCDVVKEVFHQKVYVDNTKCHVKVYQKAFSPMHLEYTPTKCTYGHKLVSCVPGPCPSDSEDTTGAGVPKSTQLRLR
mmetsp:Transcript_31841/g.48842  ORF Transcript_31841/g.48842 Transcript_31841/m.48842 type:complete len:176 (-) Transcript_31841:199-726(-)